MDSPPVQAGLIRPEGTYYLSLGATQLQDAFPRKEPSDSVLRFLNEGFTVSAYHPRTWIAATGAGKTGLNLAVEPQQPGID